MKGYPYQVIKIIYSKRRNVGNLFSWGSRKSNNRYGHYIKIHKINKWKHQKYFEELINIDLNDGVEFELERVSEIREEDNYYGYRISIISKLEKAKIPLKIDITTGDKITPSEIQYKYKLALT